MSESTQSFIKHINQFVIIDEAITKEIADLATIETFDKNHTLLKEGMVAHRLYFLHKGVLRSFYYQNGKEVTSWLYIENQVATSWYSYINKQPSFEYLQVVEEATLVSFTYEEWERLYQKHPKLERFGRKLLEAQTSFIDLFSKGYMFVSAKERYEMLLSFYPDLIHRVNLGHIASLLGINRISRQR